MLTSMSPELQKQYIAMDAYTIVSYLGVYVEQVRFERFEVSKLLFRSKMVEGTSLTHHVLKINGYVQRLDKLGFWMHRELSINLILAILPNSFANLYLTMG